MMKSVLIAASFCLFGMSASAADIVLAAGAKAYIKAGEAAVVACEGVASNNANLPVCSVGKATYNNPCHSGSDNVQVKIGSEVMECAETIEHAIARLKVFRSGGLCK